MSTVSPMAVVHDDSTIGEDSTVWHFASVIRGTKIGNDCSIGACAVLDDCQIGDRCRIGAQAFIAPTTIIHDDVFFGPGARTCNDAWPRCAKTHFDVDVITASVVIERGASVGAGAIILPGVVVGEGAMVAAGAVVKCDVPPKYIYCRDGSFRVIEDEDMRLANRVREAG